MDEHVLEFRSGDAKLELIRHGRDSKGRFTWTMVLSDPYHTTQIGLDASHVREMFRVLEREDSV